VTRSLGKLDDLEFDSLLQRARAGDEAAFAELWRAFNPPLQRFLAGMADREDAADLASTVWLEIVRGLERFEGDAVGFRSWLYTVGRMRAIDLRRSQARRPRTTAATEGREVVEDACGDPAREVERQWSTDQAVARIGSLPDDQAEVLLLRIVADLDVATVASILDKRPGTVRVLAHRGLKRLARELNGDPITVVE